tara:strand:+ start:424 stop:591 length:168 start_codon:yes stop_codon:yes gene_type:complete
MNIGDIAWDKEVHEVVIVVDVTKTGISGDPVYTVMTLDHSLGWRYLATMQVLEAL